MWLRVDLVRTDVPSTRQFTQDLHGATSQKKAFFIFFMIVDIIIIMSVIGLVAVGSAHK
jgi:hypothetical protein